MIKKENGREGKESDVGERREGWEGKKLKGRRADDDKLQNKKKKYKKENYRTRNSREWKTERREVKEESLRR